MAGDILQEPLDDADVEALSEQGGSYVAGDVVPTLFSAPLAYKLVLMRVETPTGISDLWVEVPLT